MWGGCSALPQPHLLFFTVIPRLHCTAEQRPPPHTATHTLYIGGMTACYMSPPPPFFSGLHPCPLRIITTTCVTYSKEYTAHGGSMPLQPSNPQALRRRKRNSPPPCPPLPDPHPHPCRMTSHPPPSPVGSPGSRHTQPSSRPTPWTWPARCRPRLCWRPKLSRPRSRRAPSRPASRRPPGAWAEVAASYAPCVTSPARACRSAARSARRSTTAAWTASARRGPNTSWRARRPGRQGRGGRQRG